MRPDIILKKDRVINEYGQIVLPIIFEQLLNIPFKNMSVSYYKENNELILMSTPSEEKPNIRIDSGLNLMTLPEEFYSDLKLKPKQLLTCKYIGNLKRISIKRAAPQCCICERVKKYLKNTKEIEGTKALKERFVCEECAEKVKEAFSEEHQFQKIKRLFQRKQI